MNKYGYLTEERTTEIDLTVETDPEIIDLTKSESVATICLDELREEFYDSS